MGYSGLVSIRDNALLDDATLEVRAIKRVPEAQQLIEDFIFSYKHKQEVELSTIPDAAQSIAYL